MKTQGESQGLLWGFQSDLGVLERRSGGSWGQKIERRKKKGFGNHCIHGGDTKKWGEMWGQKDHLGTLSPEDWLKEISSEKRRRRARAQGTGYPKE